MTSTTSAPHLFGPSTRAPWQRRHDGLARPLPDWVRCKLGSSAPKYDITARNQPTDLDTKQQMAVSVLQLPLPAVQLLDSLLLPLQHSDVVHRGLQNGPLIPAHVSEVGRRQRSTVRVSWPSDQLTARAKDSLWSLKPLKHYCHKDASRRWWIGREGNVQQSTTDQDWKKPKTHGSLDLGMRVPSSLMRSLMLNLRLRSTERS